MNTQTNFSKRITQIIYLMSKLFSYLIEKLSPYFKLCYLKWVFYKFGYDEAKNNESSQKGKFVIYIGLVFIYGMHYIDQKLRVSFVLN